MDIIPAIDLKGGKCVRLLQGREEQATEYSDDPVAVAAEWARQGASRIHVVNLDGAFGRASGHLDIVRRIARGFSGTVQYGGGLRSEADIEQALDAGASKIILGTVALEAPQLLETALSRYGAGRIIVALDARDGNVATRGWKNITEARLTDVARAMSQSGVREILYTDIGRDGMMSGPDTSSLPALAATGVNILVSGGVGSAADVLSLAALRIPAVTGVIIGKALYERTIDLRVLLKEVRSC